MTKYAPFDPSNPADAVADMFRRQTAELALAALEMPLYRQLSDQQQIASFMAGVMTGLLGVCLAQMKPEGRDHMMRAFKKYIPQARAQAEGIIADDDAAHATGDRDRA